MEFLPGRVSTFSCILLFADGMVLVLSSLILKFISRNTDILLYIPFYINVISLMIFGIVYVPESVKYLLEKKKYDEAKRNIEYINRINGASIEDM